MGDYRGRGGHRSTGNRDFFGGSSSYRARGSEGRRGRGYDRSEHTYAPRNVEENERTDVRPVTTQMSGMQLLTRNRPRDQDREGSTEAAAGEKRSPVGRSFTSDVRERPTPTFLQNPASRGSSTSTSVPQYRQIARRGESLTAVPNVASRGGATAAGRPTVQSTVKAPEATREPAMTDAIKFLGENSEILDAISDYLAENQNYTVISAVGPQGTGKSTLLSMIGGNDPPDLYRRYYFRPTAREAAESSRHQTTKIQIFVTKSRLILLDCQPINSASILDEAIRYSRAPKLDSRQEVAHYLEGVQLIAFLLQISHTMLVCTDWMMNMELIKALRAAELLRANLDHVAVNGVHPPLDCFRKTNLVFLHTRAKSADFATYALKNRCMLLRAMFADSRRYQLAEDDEYLLFPLADIKPRKDPSHTHNVVQVVDLLDSEEVEDFEVSLRKLRLNLAALPRPSFTENNALLSERQWVSFARSIWKDSSFQYVVSQYGSTL